MNFDLRSNSNGGGGIKGGMGGGGRRVPLVVHNGFMDLLFLMTHFEAPRLPDTLIECKQLVRSYFPLIYDTKVLSVEHCGYGEMNLQTLYGAVGDTNLLDLVYSAQDGGDAFAVAAGDADAAHQADYDALMTGAIFVGLSKHLRPLEVDAGSDEEEEEGEVADDNAGAGVRHVRAHWYNSRLGCNQIYSLGLYTLDLEKDVDPLSTGLQPQYAFRVAGIDPSITTRDIVSCVSELVDSDSRPVNFDIVWVDDTTFIVATRYRPRFEATIGTLTETPSPSDDSSGAVLAAHGQLVRDALEARFGKSLISTLEEYVQEGGTDSPSATRFWLTRLLEYVGLKRKTEPDRDDRPAKRQRRN